MFPALRGSLVADWDKSTNEQTNQLTNHLFVYFLFTYLPLCFVLTCHLDYRQHFQEEKGREKKKTVIRRSVQSYTLRPQQLVTSHVEGYFRYQQSRR